MATEASKQEKIETFNWDKIEPSEKEADFFGNKSTETEVEDIINKEEEIEVEEQQEEQEQENDGTEFSELTEEEIEELSDEDKEEYESKLAEHEEKIEKEKIAKKTVKKDPKDTTSKKKEEKKKEKEKEEEVIVAGQRGNDNEDTPVEIYAELLYDLKENGNLEYIDIPKDKKVSRKKFFELQSQNDELRLDNNLKDLFEGLDEKGKDYLKFIKDGGKTEDFIDTFVNNTIPDINIEDAKTHEDVLEYYYRNFDEQTSEESKESIDLLKEAGKDALAKKAKFYYNKMKKADEENKRVLLESQARKSKKLQKEALDFSIKLKEVTSLDEVNGIPLNGDDKKTLPDYITKPVKVLNGIKVPMWQYDLNNILKDEKQFVALCKLIKNKLNVDFIKTKSASKVAKDVRRGLENLDKGGKNTASLPANRKSLADFF